MFITINYKLLELYYFYFLGHENQLGDILNLKNIMFNFKLNFRVSSSQLELRVELPCMKRLAFILMEPGC